MSRLAAILIGLALVIGVTSSIDADPVPKIRPLFVDANDPASWGKDLEPVRASDLMRLLSLAGGRSAETAVGHLDQALYQATFREGELRDGRASFIVSSTGKTPGVVPFGEISLKLSKLRWEVGNDNVKLQDDVKHQTEAALWGSDASGRRVLVAEPGKTRLECDWSLTGRTSLDVSDFTLVLPPALVSQVVLLVPNDQTIACNTGIVSKSSSPSASGWTAWQIDLGSSSDCHLSIHRKPIAPVKPDVFFDQETTFFVSAEKLQIQSKLQLDVFSAPLSVFTLRVPPQVRVETVRYADIPLSFEVHPVKDAQEVVGRLPEPVFGKGRTVVVEASIPSRTNQLWNLPRIEMPGAVCREGQVQLTIMNPLKLLRFGNETDLAQVEAPSYSSDGEESFLLRKPYSDRPISIEVGVPAPALTGKTLARLDLRRDQALFSADVLCTASGGSTFAVDCELPNVWDVTNVEAVGEVSRIIHWSARAASRGQKRVTIDFFRALTDREPKRFRIEAARRVPRTGETIELPILRFPGFGSIDVQTIVMYSSAFDLALDPAREFGPLEEGAIEPPFADSPLRPDARAFPDQRIMIHRSAKGTNKARITLERGEEGFSAKARSTIDLGTSRMTQRVYATVTPQAGPLDRLFVYLTSEGPPLTWLLVTGQPRPLDATRIAPSRHSEWNLPVGGELWELRIPEIQHGEFRVEGARKTSSLGSAKVSLAYLPGARSFSGTVEVRSDNALPFDVVALGLKPMRLMADRHTAALRSENRLVRAWTYERPTDSLVVKPRQAASPKSVDQFAALDLQSYFYCGGTGDDVYHATFSVAPLSGARPFQFKLNPLARLSLVTVNGRTVRVQHHADEVTVPSLPSERWNTVEIHYTASPTEHILREDRQTIVPRADADILRFRWRLALAPGLRPSGEPTAMQWNEPPPALSWLEKLFGPLGRPAREWKLPTLSKASWLADLGIDADAPADVFADMDFDRPPPNWTQWSASADQVPPVLSIVVWHEPELRTLAWIVCLGCLMAGIVLQRYRVRYRIGLGVMLLAVAAAATVLSAEPYSLLMGAAMSGTILAFLFSQPWLARPAVKRATTLGVLRQERSRLGSTASFEHRAMLLLGAIGVAYCATAWAQEPRTAAPGPSAIAPREDVKTTTDSGSSPERELIVVVPTTLGTKPATSLADSDHLVYVRRDELERLRQKQGDNRTVENYVFLSAEYGIAVDERRVPAIQVKYQVAVSSSKATSILLPLSKVTLSGANACQLNGHPYPLRKADDGFVLTLPPNGSGVADREEVSSVEKSSDENSAEALVGKRHPASAPRPELVDPSPRQRIVTISLSVFPEPSNANNPTVFEFGVPRVAGTMVRRLPSRFTPPLSLEGESGGPRTLQAGELAAVELPETKWIRLTLGKVPAPSSEPIEAKAIQLIRVSPTLIEIDCRVTYAVNDRDVRDLEWLIPADAAVRSSVDNYQIVRDSPTADGRSVPLKFALPAKPSGPLTLAVTLIIPVAGRPSTLSIPLLQFSAGGVPVKLVSNQVGVTAVSGYRPVVTTNEPDLSHTAAADPRFRQESRGAPRKEPEIIFDARRASMLIVELKPIAPSHKVRMTHDARLSTELLQWKTTAEIRTENAPAYVDVLRVDPRLKIESLSIREDGVERLVRYSRNGENVTLFLRDRAAATQDLVLTASMPLDLGREVTLPEIALVGATDADVRLRLEPDSQVDVTVTSVHGATETTHPHDAGSNEPAGSRTRDYLLDKNSDLPTIRVMRRAEKPRIACTTVVQQKNPEALDVTVRLHLSEATGPDGPVEIKIALPQNLAPGCTITADVKNHVWRHADGTAGIAFDATPKHGPANVEIRWTESPRDGSWQLPVVSAANAVIGESFLFLSDAIAWQPSPDSATRVQESSRPEWMRSLLPEQEKFHGWKSTVPAPSKWVLTRRVSSPARRPRIQIYTRLSLHTDGEAVGATFFHMEEFDEPALTVNWPSNAKFRAAFLDGQPVQPIPGELGQWAIPVEFSGHEHRVALHWTDSSQTTLGALSKVFEEVPLPENITAKSMLLAVTVPAGFHLVATSAFQEIDPSVFANECDSIVRIEREDTAANSEFVPFEWTEAHAFETESGRRMLGRLALPPTPGPLRIWVFREFLLTAPLGLAVFALALTFLVKLARSRASDWFIVHPVIISVIVGTAWFFFLSPRVIGVFLAVLPLIWLFFSRKTRRASGKSGLPSTVQVHA